MKYLLYAIPLLLLSPYLTISKSSSSPLYSPKDHHHSPIYKDNFSQQDSLITVHGSIKNEDSNIIVGAIISVKGQSLNTISNEQGMYILRVKPNATLHINKTGFARHEEVVNNRSEIHITLKITGDESIPKDSLISNTEIIDSPIDPSPTLGKGATKTAKVSQNTGYGIVRDKSGPIRGVTVSVKGQATSAATDDQGRFQITAKSGDVLIFSAIGYQEHEKSFITGENLDIVLNPDSKAIESVQVVAVGYGTMDRATLPSSVSSIGADELENEILPSVPQAIQGKAGGVQVTQKSGSPGGGLSIRVRGTTSINASSDPLYVVDGIPVNSTTNFTGGSNFNFGGGTQGINVLSSLNPSDVQSIEILKDAASSSIYGARAANGVVLITTKKGKPGTSAFHFNMYEGYSEMPSERKYEMMNTEQYQSYMQDYYNIVLQNAQLINPDTIINIPGQILSNSNINTDWQDAMLRKAGTRSYELAASGGSEKTQYYVSLGYMRQGGIMLNSDFNRVSGRINLNHQHNEKLRFSSAINVTRAENDRIQEENSKEGPTKTGIFSPPNIPVYDASGNYVYDEVSLTRENPVAMLTLPTNNAQTWRVLGNISAEYQFIPSLTLKTAFGTDISFIDETFFMPPIGIRSFASQGGIGARRNTRDQLWINETTITYDKQFGDHAFNALGGFSVQESRLEFIHGQRSNFPSNDIKHIRAGGVITGADGYPEEWAIASGFTRINYNYKRKYILTANLRMDGSSRFGKDNRWATFPSFAAAWRLSEEDFLQKISFISDLKLRASWGITGNQNIGNYASYSLYTGGHNYLGMPGFLPSLLGDRNLKWETTKQTDVGIDVGLFNGRISILADYYHKKTSDLLIGVPILDHSGYTNRFTNSGDIENKGFEFELTTRNLVGSFKWTTSLNMTFNRNKVISLPNDIDHILGGVGSLNLAREGFPLGSFYGWKMIGVNPETGMIDYMGANGQPTTPTVDSDRQIIGNPHPDFFGGITNTFQYRNFDLSVMGQFTYGNDMFNYTLASGLEGYSASSNAFIDWIDRWRQPGDVTDVPRPSPGSFDNGAISDRFVQDGSFFRLRNITLGYSLPSSATERLKVSKLRAYITIQNAYVFTKYRGFDPEVSSSHGGANTGLIYGYDYGSYPQPRIFTAGIHLSL